ncbi:AAA family ATPase [Spirosoma rhododendri]|uniref:AAA family ATPase n=1 Tax=Spirosoma rhododendri TaxID=2728024 RepID=A0A7L5DL22_9BACT|nr:AAA family ATPase [Spirosoma rhododendri]QJD79184.1 AAA family ATPase [Spirosoma rhododendri]
MKRVLILIGLSGSGKSTLARQFCRDKPDYLRVNRDDLRRSLLSVSLSEYNQTWPEHQRDRVERMVNELQTTTILKGLKQGWNLLIDNTNLRPSYLSQFRKLLLSQSDPVEVTYQLVDTPVEECIRRDKYRDDSVGEDVIRRQAQQLAALKKSVDFKPELLSPADWSEAITPAEVAETPTDYQAEAYRQWKLMNEK